MDRWTLQSESLQRGLDALKHELRTSSLMATEVIDRRPDLQPFFTISETAPLYTNTLDEVFVAGKSDISCYDTGFHVSDGGGYSRCKKGGSGCWVEIPCPMGIGNQQPYEFAQTP